MTQPTSRGRDTPHNLAMSRPLRPAAVTVTRITRKTMALSSVPPSMPTRASSTAKYEAIAAATMPRGPIQATNSF